MNMIGLGFGVTVRTEASGQHRSRTNFRRSHLLFLRD
jgi:hypothetical protein